jgi:hypothetical protein
MPSRGLKEIRGCADRREGERGGVRAIACALIAAASLGGLSGCRLDTKPGATSIFQAFQEPTPEEAARMAIDRLDANNRYRGTLLLSGQPFASEPLYIQLFADNIKDADPGVRAVSVRALGNHGRPEHAPLLIEALKDTDALVRREAARALQRLHDPQAVAPLLVAVREPDLDDPEVPSEPDPEVRVEAAAALGQYAEPKVFEALVQSLADSRLAVNRAAQNSLRVLTGQDFGLDRRGWLDWAKDNSELFKGQAVYSYPVFSREKSLIEYIPFVPQPPNEPTSTPLGMPLPGPR